MADAQLKPHGTPVAAALAMPPDAVIGFHCSHEQHSPSALLRHVQLAAQAGFGGAMCSDHFQPWSERQGHSGYAWSWLGAALSSTPLSFGTVCAPGQRYHPAIVAQAAATLAEMYTDRFWLALGSGEAINEMVTGEAWPPKPARNDRLRQSADLMRALWAGEEVPAGSDLSARLYVRPDRPPLLLGAALSQETARWVAGWADGMITVAGAREEMRRMVAAFREHGGEEKPIFLQVPLSFAPTDGESVEAAFDQWRQSGLSSGELADLATPAQFDHAVERVTRADVLSKVRASSDIARQIAWVHEDAALGYERIYLHNVARAHQEHFIDACAAYLAPRPVTS